MLMKVNNMKNLSFAGKVYILGTILIGLGLIGWMAVSLEWANFGLYVLAILGAVAQTLKVEGPNNKTNYSIAWFVYGFAFIAYGLPAAMFVIVISHLAEWAWHKYPWFIQSFNIANHVLSVFLAGMVYQFVSQGAEVSSINGAIAMILANLTFVFGNHFLVGLVVKLARGQSFAESGVFGFLTLFLDFSILSMGGIAALLWAYNPFVSLVNIMPLYLLYNALRVPALKRQIAELKS
jgi:hypothetical protein